MPYVQFLAIAKRPIPAFQNRRDYAELWARLRAEFPSAIAAALMPDHVHLSVDTSSPELAHARFIQALAAFSRSRRRSIWSKIEPPERILNQKHLLRNIRYLHLNPCRDSLTQDPLTWEWTTHRDAVGAVGDPWMDLSAVSRLMQVTPRELAPRIHAYVSGDPSVRVHGTPPPPHGPVPMAASLRSVRDAILLANRIPEVQRGRSRKLIVHLARQVGQAKCGELAQILGVTPKTITLLAASDLTPREEHAVRAGRVVLSDPRLLLRIDS